MSAPQKKLYRNEEQSTLVLYDLRDPEALERAGRERAAWERSRTTVYTLDNDHVAIEFKPGGALERTS